MFEDLVVGGAVVGSSVLTDCPVVLSGMFGNVVVCKDFGASVVRVMDAGVVTVVVEVVDVALVVVIVVVGTSDVADVVVCMLD